MNSSAKNVLTGDLKYLGLGDILQLIGANGSTGVLKLSCRFAPHPALLYFKDGNPVDARCGDLGGLDALYPLFGWTEGAFEFTQEAVHGQKVINKSRMGIILEGLKLKDDGKIEIIGPDSLLGVAKTTGFSGEEIPLVKGPLVDYMYVVDEEDFFDGEHIVEEGRHGNWMWVILEGVVEIAKETSAGTLPILRLGSGCFVGSLATFLVHGNIRAASVVAVGNVQLGVLDSQRLAQEYAGLPREFRHLLVSLDRRLKATTARVIATRTGKQLISPDLDAMTPFLPQRDAAEEILHVIHSGEVWVHRERPKPLTLARLGKGDYVGHLPFLHLRQEPEFAAVYADAELVTESVPVAPLKEAYEGMSSTFKNIVDNAAACVSVTTELLSAVSEQKGTLTTN
ncbi:MAG: cyclic nucleotide-binding domain-containing protein [Desulfosarcinaceae bacterium]|nr:cyclic nucleotide-binding domain-containing protein [Desulfosarcinaceae bacterium]